MSKKGSVGHCGFCADCNEDTILHKSSLSLAGHFFNLIFTMISNGAWLIIWLLSWWIIGRSWKCMACDGKNVELTGGFDFLLKELDGCILHGDQKSMLDGKSYAASFEELWSPLSISLQATECNECGGHKFEAEKFCLYYAGFELFEEVESRRAKGEGFEYSNQFVESGWVVFPMLDGRGAHLSCLDCGNQMESVESVNLAAGAAVVAQSAWAAYSLFSRN